MPKKILIVEDESDICTLLEHLLQQEGYAVTVTGDGNEALELIDQDRPDLMVLDLMLPGVSGFEILKRVKLQSDGHTRVLVLTARVEEVDRILGFELGADDYVTKPFSPRELVLRIRALLKRDRIETPANGATVRVGPIEIDQENHSVRVGSNAIQLTLTEFRLLADLMRAPGRVRTRERLLSEVWGYDTEVMSRTVDTHVRRLRQKLGDASRWLETVRGVGYRIQDPARAR